MDPELDLRPRAASARRCWCSPRRGSSRCWARRRRSSTASPAPRSSAPRYEPPFPFIAGGGVRRRAGTPCCRPTSSAPTTAPASCTPRSRSARTTSGSASSTASNVVNPVRPDGTYDERIGPYAGRSVKDADPDLIADLDAARAAASAPRSTSTPIRTAGAATRRCSTTPRRAGTSARPRASDELLAANEAIEWYPFHIKHGPLRQVAREQRRLGAVARALLGHAAAGLALRGGTRPLRRLDRRAARAGRRRPRRPAQALHRRGDVPLPRLRRRDAARAGGDRRLVRLGRDAVRASSTTRSRTRSCSSSASRPTSSARRSTRRAAGSTRCWWKSSLLFDRASYKNVLCLGLILDQDGQKMSKSRGNVVGPVGRDRPPRRGCVPLVLLHLPAAVVRVPVLDRDGRRERAQVPAHAVEHVQLLRPVRERRRVRPRAHDVAPADRPALDRWVLSRLQNTIATVRDELDAYDTTAGRPRDRGVRGRSLQLVRAALAAGASGRATRRDAESGVAAYLTLHEALVTVSKLLAPFTPFVADEIYGNLDGTEPSVHLCDFPEPDEALVDRELEIDMAVARRTVELGRAARSQAKVKVRQPLPRGGRGGRRARARGDRAPRGAGARRAEREGDLVRERGRGAGRLRGEAQLPGSGARGSAHGCRRRRRRSRSSTRPRSRLLRPGRERHHRGRRQGGVAGSGRPLARDAAARAVTSSSARPTTRSR